jgi:hypothetical protein
MEKIMSFQGLPDDGILLPDEVAMIQRVFDRVVSAGKVSSDPVVRAEFAKFVFKTYRRGLCLEEQLYEICSIAARRKFACVSDVSAGTELAR